MKALLATVFGWPNGIVVGNLLASALWVPITGAALYLLRNRWMRRLVAFHHKHKTLHDQGIK